MCKRFLLILFSISFILADQVEHDYNSAVPTFTKTPHPGRMSVSVGYADSRYTHGYVGKQNTALIDKFDLNGFAVSAMYHGVNGIGFKGFQMMEDFSFDSGNKPSRITSSFGMYLAWNEIYPESSPSMLDGHQFTFPTTKILTGISYTRLKDIDNNYYEALFLTGAMDLIISNELILTNFLKFDIIDDDDKSWSVLSSKLVYDLDEKISIAPSFTYAQNNSGDYENFVMIEGGYQFRDLNYGYLHVDAKISPYLRFNVAGQNVTYPNKEAGVNFYFFFN